MFSDLADGCSILFFDVASQTCNSVDIMNLEVLQYSSKLKTFFLDKNKGPALHVLSESKLKFLLNISRIIPNQ